MEKTVGKYALDRVEPLTRPFIISTAIAAAGEDERYSDI